MRPSVVGWIAFYLCLQISPTISNAASTGELLGAMTVCAGGLSLKISANLEGSITSLYENESTKGTADQQIMTKVAEMLPNGKVYDRYVQCVLAILNRPEQNSGYLPYDILNRVKLGEFGETNFDYITAVLGPAANTTRYIEGFYCDIPDGIGYMNVARFYPKGFVVDVVYLERTKEVYGIRVRIDNISQKIETGISLDAYWNEGYFPAKSFLGFTTFNNVMRKDECGFATDDGIWNNKDPEYYCSFADGSHADNYMSVKIYVVNQETYDTDEMSAYDIHDVLMYYQGLENLLDKEKIPKMIADLGLGSKEKDDAVATLRAMLRVRINDWRITGIEVFNGLVGGDVSGVISSDEFYQEEIAKGWAKESYCKSP